MLCGLAYLLLLVHGLQHDRELKYSTLKNALDTYSSTQIRGDERFHAFAQEEIAKIQNALVAEAQVQIQLYLLSALPQLN